MSESQRAKVDAAKVDLYLAGHQRGGDMSLAQRAFYRLIWYVVQAFLRTYFRVRVTGAQNVPSTGPFILSAIHRSNVDTPVVSAVTRRRLRYMGKESLWSSSLTGWFFSTAGGFPVQRGSADREALRACKEVLERGEPLVLFPEGTRQQGPRVQPLFHGAAYLACSTGAPIVPVGIGGSEAAMPKGARMVRPKRISVVVGEPLWPPAQTGERRVPRRAVRELTEELSEHIQAAFDEASSRS